MEILMAVVLGGWVLSGIKSSARMVGEIIASKVEERPSFAKALAIIGGAFFMGPILDALADGLHDFQ